MQAIQGLLKITTTILKELKYYLATLIIIMALAAIKDHTKQYDYPKEFYKTAQNESVINSEGNEYFNQVLGNTLGHEGGYTVDQGGPTFRGVTQATWDAYSEQSGLEAKSVKNLTPSDIQSVYYDNYYKGPSIDMITPLKTQGVLFDYAVNSGPATAVKELQRIVGVNADGIIGPKTSKAVTMFGKKYGDEALARVLLEKRRKYLQGLAKNNPKKHGGSLNGWMNRLDNLIAQYGLDINAQEQTNGQESQAR